MKLIFLPPLWIYSEVVTEILATVFDRFWSVKGKWSCNLQLGIIL